MFGPDIELSTPPAHWFKFPPSSLPQILPPPAPDNGEFTLKSPFAINHALYNKALTPALPITFAACYLVVVTLLNVINGQRKLKPYEFSKTSVFRGFVMLHNAGLALYSLVTCIAMLRAMRVSFPGFLGQDGLPGAVDALCKMSGPRGLGDAVTYSPSTSTWASRNTKILLGEDLKYPDSTDVGRIWNEGLAFWGWLFYLSKYYEIVDNVIILVKGKQCSALQVYHHCGALLCMWAGIRYMSPPIWMFVLFNSGVHFLMYTYYTYTGLGYKVSRRVKKTLTTLQISQFVVGAFFAAAHLFVSYSVPVSVPYTVKSLVSNVDLKSVASSAKSAASSAASGASSAAMGFKTFAEDMFTSKSRSSLAAKATSEASSLASSMMNRASTTASSLATEATEAASSLATQASVTASALASKALADDGAWFKKLLYRAAGREALAEAVRNPSGELFGPEFDENLIKRTVEEYTEEIRHYTEYQTVHCLDTEGQAFAIWFNIAYLVPLTFIFLNFFRKTYARKGNGKQRTVSESAEVAARKTKKELNLMYKKVEQAVEQGEEKIHLSEGIEKAKQKVKELDEEYHIQDRVQHIKEELSGMVQNVMGAKDSGELMEEQENEVGNAVKGEESHNEPRTARPAADEAKPIVITIAVKPTSSNGSATPTGSPTKPKHTSGGGSSVSSSTSSLSQRGKSNSTSNSTSSLPTPGGQNKVHKGGNGATGGGGGNGSHGSGGAGGNAPNTPTPKSEHKKKA